MSAVSAANVAGNILPCFARAYQSNCLLETKRTANELVSVVKEDFFALICMCPQQMLLATYFLVLPELTNQFASEKLSDLPDLQMTSFQW